MACLRPQVRRLRWMAREGVRKGSLALCRDVVEAASRALFRGGGLRVFEAAGQEAGFFEAIERAIEGAVSGEPPCLFAFLEFGGNGIAMELGLSGEVQRDPCGEDRDLDWHEGAGFATHGERIRR